MLLALAAALGMAAWVWLVVLGFRKHVGWGLAVLLIPSACLVLILRDWTRGKRPFFLGLAAVSLAAGGVFVAVKWHFAARLIPPAAVAYVRSHGGPLADKALSMLPKIATAPVPARIDERLEALKAQEKELLQKKAALDPKNKSAALALTQEIALYNAALRAALVPKETPAPPPMNAPASGQIAGQPFSVEQATVKDGILTLRQGKGFFADREVSIFLFLKDTESPAGRKWKVPAAQSAPAPHVHLSWRDQAKDLPMTKVFIEDYELQLEFESGANGQVTGRISLVTRDDARVAGTFTAQVLAAR